MSQIINGQKIAENLQKNLRRQIKKNKIKPGLAIIQVGAYAPSNIYVGLKKKKCEKIGMDCKIFKLPRSVSTIRVINLIKKLNRNQKIHGLIVQLPLPKKLDQEKIITNIAPAKDADGLTPENLGRLMKGQPQVIPATSRGIIELIKSTGLKIAGKKAVVVGRSNIVGKPVAQLLLQENASVTICHSQTKNLSSETKTADILVAAAGVPNLIKASMIKKNAIVIDVGINRLKNKIIGDVDFKNVSLKASYITPVPGGVGPMTVVMLLQNVWELALAEKNKNS